LIDVLGAVEEVAGEQWRRSNGGAAAGVRFPARTGEVLIN
jgi:hypothetical protein